MERNAKIRKLFAKAGLTSYVTHLAKTLEALRTLDEEELEMILGMKTRKSLQGSVDEVWDELRVAVRIPLVSGGNYTLDIVSWTKALQHAVRTSSSFRELLTALFRAHACTLTNPYSLAYYADETIPGNTVNLDFPRKTLAMSASIKELGPSTLSLGAAWIPLVFVRSIVCKTIVGGGGAVFTVLLRQMFLVEKIATQGVLLDLDVGTVAFYFRMGNCLLDGDTIGMMYGSKRGRPELPCIGCLNVVSDGALVRDDNGLVPLSCVDASLLSIASNEDLWQKADALEDAAARHNATALKQLETSLGLNYHPEGFLWCKPLRHFIRPAETLTFDPMHILLSQGVADLEYEHLLPRLSEEGIASLGPTCFAIARLTGRLPRVLDAGRTSSRCSGPTGRLTGGAPAPSV